MRRLLKFLHTLGAAGLIGGLAALVVIITFAPGSMGAFPVREAMARIAAWIVGPSMVVTVIAGLLAIAINPVFHEAGWAWAKAATGILILEGCLHVMGPIGEAAKRGASGAAAGAAPVSTTGLLTGESATLWVLLAVCAANIALAIWKPRLPQIPV